MENQEQSFDFSNDFEVQFEAGKEYQVIITDAKFVTKDSGKNCISHTFIGLKGEKFTKDFYIDSEGGRGFYTRFLSRCGISREETKSWLPSQLNGRFVNVIFHNKDYDEIVTDEYGNITTKTKSSFKIKTFRTSSATQEIMTKLEKVMEGKQPEDGCPF